MQRLKVLDGWRGISISLVMLGHLFPVGPSAWNMNGSFAASGMVIFFILSGFLMCSILLKNQNIPRFLIRRIFRIVPLAWLVLFLTFLYFDANIETQLSHYFFLNNVLLNEIPSTSHFWSLSIELQFYVAIAVIVLLFGKRGLYALVFLSILVTANRMLNGVEISIRTYYRVDEILAGSVLALIYNDDRSLAKKITRILEKINPFLMLPILLLCAHPNAGPMNYLRPYVAMIMIGSSLYNYEKKFWYPILCSKTLRYLATISYALYVIHGVFRETWLASGDKIVKYTKRPLFLFVTFVLAHISTKYFENYWISLGRRITTKK